MIKRTVEAGPKKRRRVSVGFAWYDLWIGAYWSADNRTLYVCPVPTLLITVRPKSQEVEGLWPPRM